MEWEIKGEYADGDWPGILNFRIEKWNAVVADGEGFR